MTEPEEIAHFHDRCSPFMRELLDGLASSPDRPRPFPEIEDAIGWPRRRIASVLGGVAHLRQTQFGGRRPYRFLSDRDSTSGRWEMWMDADQANALRTAARSAAASATPATSATSATSAASAASAASPASDAADSSSG